MRVKLNETTRAIAVIERELTKLDPEDQMRVVQFITHGMAARARKARGAEPPTLEPQQAGLRAVLGTTAPVLPFP